MNLIIKKTWLLRAYKLSQYSALFLFALNSSRAKPTDTQTEQCQETPIFKEYEDWSKRHQAEELTPIHIEPIDLISPHRFDITAKYLYAYYQKHKVNSSWAFEIYAEHLRVWNKFCEGVPHKRGLTDFVKAFNNTLDSISKKGFDNCSFKIPVIQKNNGWKALNCAHRIAACAVYRPEEKILCHSLCKYSNPFVANWNTFKKMNTEHLDAMALQYCQLKKSCAIFILFPRAQGNPDAVREILKKHGAIIYEKTVPLQWQGAINLIRTTYEGEPWLGNKDNSFKGAQGKAFSCFPEKHGLCTVFLYKAEKNQEITKIKKDIRALFNVGNHSIHSTDTHSQALRLAQTLFLKNSIHFLNYAQMGISKNLEKLCTEYNNWLALHNYNTEHFCIDSSGTLAAYGLRDCNDLDFLTHEEKFEAPNNKKIENHESQLCHYATTKDDIIFNPTNHFYYKGLKFASLDTIKKMKMHRGETPKDVRDIELINAIPENGQKISFYIL